MALAVAHSPAVRMKEAHASASIRKHARTQRPLRAGFIPNWFSPAHGKQPKALLADLDGESYVGADGYLNSLRILKVRVHATA
eukprot:6187210-Pleurochrysis_carterae.AAC.1